jgi:acetylornithine deacetylase/succinyl-diaminopimelate desuccinylase family protein
MAETTEAVLSILKDLIAIPSTYPPGNTEAICAYAAARLEKAGYAVETHSRAEGIANVVARMGSGSPSVVFNAHADTVGVGERAEWRTDPFEGCAVDGKVHGLGAGNCKASMAVQLWLAEAIAARGGPKTGEVVFTFVGDEERLGPDGLQFLREAGVVKPDYLILGAQTQNQAIAEERGVFWVRIAASGRAAHAGDPDAGDNAIARMIRLIGALERELSPRLAIRRRDGLKSTMNIGTIRGGHNINAVPSDCVIEIDRRTLPEEKVAEAYAEMEAILAMSGEPEGGYRIEFLTGTNGFASKDGAPCISAFHEAIEAVSGESPRNIVAVGASDGRYFADDGIEILTFGPGSAHEGHAANESVPLADLAPCAKIQLAVVEKLLELGG